MPQVKLSGMKVEALLDLQDRIDEMLRKHRAEIEQRLERINRAIFIVNEARVAREGRSTLKGRKSHRNIEVRQVKLGQGVAQDLGGLLLPSKVERRSTIF
jgi:hypothetical protein